MTGAQVVDRKVSFSCSCEIKKSGLAVKPCVNVKAADTHSDWLFSCFKFQSSPFQEVMKHQQTCKTKNI
jgi:hypothetical protein